MKRRLVVPAAVAMALHAALLFGFRTGAHPDRDGDHPSLPPAPRPDSIVQVEWPPEAATDDSPTAKGVPAEPSPALPPLPFREVRDEITITPDVPNPRPIHPNPRIPLGPWGNTDGNADGPAVIGGPLDIAGLDNAPRTRSQVSPVYPYEARVAGKTGEVMVEFVVDENGHVVDPHVVRSNDPVFDAPSLRAVSKWRFEPGRKNGRVVRFRMAVPVAFTVNS